MPVRFLSLFSGIEAASAAWIPLGWQCVGVAEIEKFPCSVLRHRYPEVPNLGNVMAIDFIDKAVKLGPVDVLIGGPPCQAFSVAGLRESLNDERGNMTLRFVEIINAVNPGTILFENVPGILSTKDNAFGCFLAALVGADDAIVPERGWTNAGMVSGPRRNAAWRVLDAQYFGLAQRRKRVFVVACPRNGADPREILFECEGVPRHSPPRREAGERVAADVAKRAGIGFEVGPGGGRDVDVACTMDARARDGAIRNQVGMLAMSPIGLDEEQNATVDYFGTLKARMEGGGFEGSVFVPDNSHCLNAGGMGRIDYETETLVAHTLKKRYDFSEDGYRGEPAEVLRRAGVRWGLSRQRILQPPCPTSETRSAFGVRRLLPVECEILMGFPKDYTALDKAADGPRYKALGNSMAVPVVRWIGLRIVKALKAQNMERAA